MTTWITTTYETGDVVLDVVDDVPTTAGTYTLHVAVSIAAWRIEQLGRTIAIGQACRYATRILRRARAPLN